MAEYESARAQFEAMGPEKVRAAMAGNSFGEQRKRWAQDWLDEGASSRKEASHAESNAIARSAKNAAWVAAISAMIAIPIAIASLFISIFRPFAD